MFIIFKVNKPFEIKEIINKCSEEKWTEMSKACKDWYEKIVR